MTNEFAIETKQLCLTPSQLDEVENFYQLNIDPFIRKFLWDDELISKQTTNEIVVASQQYFRD